MELYTPVSASQYQVGEARGCIGNGVVELIAKQIGINLVSTRGTSNPFNIRGIPSGTLHMGRNTWGRKRLFKLATLTIYTKQSEVR